MTRRLAPFFVLLAIACEDDGIAPGERILNPGVYAYSTVFTRPESDVPDTLAGTLHIVDVTPAQVVTLWSVPQFTPDTVIGGWNENAYALLVQTQWQGEAVHRLHRDGNVVACQITYRWRPDYDAAWQTTTRACTVY